MIIILFLLLLTGRAYSSEYESIKQFQELNKPVEIVITYEEISDCDKPSVWEKICDKDDHCSYVVKSPCEE